MQAPQEALQQEQRLFQALQILSARIATFHDRDPLLEALVQGVTEVLGYYNARVFLLDEGREELYLVASARPPAPSVDTPRFRIGPEGAIGRVASSEAPLLIPDVAQCDFSTPSDPAIRSEMAVPMFVGGRLVGVLDVESDRPHAFQAQDLAVMTALANQTAAALEAARLLQESRTTTIALEQQARNLMLINRISTTLASSLDAYEILDVSLRHLVELSEADYGGVLIVERGRERGLIAAEYPFRRLTGTRLPLPHLPSARRMLEAGIPYAIKDALHHPLLDPLREQIAPLDIRSLLLVPMVARDEMIGILLLASLGRRRTFNDEEMELCQTVVNQAAAAIANARLLQDIQQQSRALARKSQELAEESSKLDAILNNIADGLVVTDPTGRIILSNPAFREMAGLPSGRSLRGRLLAESFPVAGLQPLTDQALHAPGQVFTENLELPDGRVLKTSATALRLPPPVLEPEQGEQIAGVVTVLRDITHEVEVDRMKTDFISAVSHELRTPLTSILGFASLIQREFRRRIAPHVAADDRARQVADRILDNLTIIDRESRRLTRLINDVLDIAKMEAGRVEWHMAETDLSGVIQSAVAATSALAEEKNLPIQVYLPPEGLPPVWGDRDRLIQVMTNLLSNAIKFTERGQVEVRGWRLTVEGETLRCAGPFPIPYEPASEIQETLTGLHFSDGEWVVVSVVDTGIGIPDEDLPRVFEKFTQVGDTLTEKPRGTGLGLSICREIIEHHGGRIWARSRFGLGSTFSFALPLKVAPASGRTRPAAWSPGTVAKPITAHSISATAPALPSRGRGHTILVADDEANIRRMLRQELSEAGYRVIEAADGAEALAQARQEQPDLIVLDVMMPGVSGFDVTSALKADERTQKIPIVILSIVEDRERGLRLGADAYLTKPVDTVRLLKVVETLIATRGLE